MARELLLGGRSVRVADDRTYRCGLGDVAHVAVRVAQLAIGGISMSGAPAAAAQELLSLSSGGVLGVSAESDRTWEYSRLLLLLFRAEFYCTVKYSRARQIAIFACVLQNFLACGGRE